MNDNVAGSPGELAPKSAIACVLIEPSHVQLIEQLRDSGHPVLGINRYLLGHRTIPTVRMDDAAGIELAVDYLVSLGHRQISFIRGPLDNIDSNERLTRFRAATERHGSTVIMEAGDDLARPRAA